MSGTTQRHALPAWATILDSLDTLARLPAWLERAADTARLTETLRRSVPEFTSGALALHKCRSKHLLLSRDGASWSGTYYCTVADPSTTQQRSVALRGVLRPPHIALPDAAGTPTPFASDAWQFVVPELRLAFQMQPPETQLDALAELTNPEQARVLLEQSMERQIASCHPEVLRYHPGLRCTIGYHLTYQDADSSHQSLPPFVVAKTYDDERGRIAYEGMHALWVSPLGASTRVAIAEPIAYVPERRLLVQGPLSEEQTLYALIETTLQTQSATSIAQLNDYLRKTAIGLAELHSSGVTVGRSDASSVRETICS